MASRPEREALKRVRHEEMAPRSGSQPNLGAGILAREVTGLRAADVRIGDGQRVLKDAHCHRCGVRVPVMGRAADGAGPVADSQPLGARILVTTDRAELAGPSSASEPASGPAAWGHGGAIHDTRSASDSYLLLARGYL